MKFQTNNTIKKNYLYSLHIGLKEKNTFKNKTKEKSWHDCYCHCVLLTNMCVYNDIFILLFLIISEYNIRTSKSYNIIYAVEVIHHSEQSLKFKTIERTLQESNYFAFIWHNGYETKYPTVLRFVICLRVYLLHPSRYYYSRMGL